MLLRELLAHVTNWHYRVAGKAYEPTLIVATEPRHPVINWRDQLVAMASFEPRSPTFLQQLVNPEKLKYR